MRTILIVVGAPGGEAGPKIGEVGEQRLVEQLVPQPAIEAFDEAILHRLARGDVMPVDPLSVGKAQDSVRGELGAVAHWEDGSAVG